MIKWEKSMALRVYNTMARSVEEFLPIKKDEVGFYGCGPTVYNYAHIGNLRAYVFLDLLNRTFSYLGYTVNHVMNITDIGHLTGDSDDGEDKMLKTAQEKGKTVLEIAAYYTEAFFKDIDALNIKRPTVICKATDHIPEMIALIERLEKNGHTYMAGGNLYFDVSTFPEYGKLARINMDDLKAGARIDIDENKKNPFDFVLWFTKSKFENQALVWDSPWGKGYPGWHIECSAMSMKYLGENFDIHTGGIDHIPIHHTNEIAQSEGATGKKWVNYWLHNEFLVLSKEEGKMSKSSGSFLRLSSLLEKGYEALDYRFFLLGAHYRSQLAFSWQAMDSAKQSRRALLGRIAKILETITEEKREALLQKDLSQLGEKARAHHKAFISAIEDDLSSPRCLSELQMLVKNPDISNEEKLLLIQDFDTVLALDLLASAKELTEKKEDENTISSELLAELEKRIKERDEAKKEKDYARADAIRNELLANGIMLIDSPEGTSWKKQN